jgi:hypothetical protein
LPGGLAAALGCGDSQAAEKLDSVTAIPDLQQIGVVVAAQKVDRAHFNFDTFKP